MDIAKEIVTLINFSPKRESLLQQLKENLETEDEDASSRGIIGLYPTRWKVRASCFRRILENYSVLMEEWDVCLSERLQPDVRARIIGCKAQMERFDFSLVCILESGFIPTPIIYLRLFRVRRWLLLVGNA